MFLGHLIAALAWDKTTLSLHYTPAQNDACGKWSASLLGPMVPTAAAGPCEDESAWRALAALDTVVGHSLLRRNINALPILDDPIQMGLELDNKFEQLIAKKQKTDPMIFDVEVISGIFKVSVLATVPSIEHEYGYTTMDVGLDLHTALMRALDRVPRSVMIVAAG